MYWRKRKCGTLTELIVSQLFVQQVSRLPPGNMLAFEPARFTTLHNNQRFLSLRTTEVVSLHYMVNGHFAALPPYAVLLGLGEVLNTVFKRRGVGLLLKREQNLANFLNVYTQRFDWLLLKRSSLIR